MDKNENLALAKNSKFNSFLSRINPKNWFSFSSNDLSNQTLPRRSEIKIKDEKEQKDLLADCTDFYKEIKSSFKVDDVYNLLGLLHYSIGMKDYQLYNRSDNENLSKREVEIYLARRAYYSAMIQAFENDISKHGIDVQEYYKTRIIDESPNVPDTIYHGTTANVTIDELGKKDKDTGKYYIKDGVSYFTNKENAQKFASIDNNNNNNSKVLAKDIDKKDCREIEMTDGYTCFISQDQLKEYCDNGIKYLFSPRSPQILDISEFSNFVKERDETILNVLNRFNLKLPNKDQTIDEYFDSMNINRNLVANAVMWTPRGINPAEHDEKYQKIKDMTYEELFPTLQKSIGTNPENSFTEKLKVDQSQLKQTSLNNSKDKSKDLNINKNKNSKNDIVKE